MQLLNQCLVIFRREQKRPEQKPEPPIRTEAEYREAVTVLAQQLRRIV